jgi:hypothetical protein
VGEIAQSPRFKPAVFKVRDVSRREACLAQAAVCREKAEADAVNQDFWISEAIRWLELAINPAGHAAVSAESSAPKIPVGGT